MWSVEDMNLCYWSEHRRRDLSPWGQGFNFICSDLLSHHNDFKDWTFCPWPYVSHVSPMGCFTSTACIWLTEPTRPLSLLDKFFGCYLVLKLATGAAVEHRSVYDPSQWVYGCLLSQSVWCGVLAWWLAGSLSTAVMAEHSQQSSQEQTAAIKLRKLDQGRLWQHKHWIQFKQGIGRYNDSFNNY